MKHFPIDSLLNCKNDGETDISTEVTETKYQLQSKTSYSDPGMSYSKMVSTNTR